MKRGTTHPGADLSDQPFNFFFLIYCFRKYLNLYFLDNNLFNGRKISQLHMTDRVHVIKYPLYKFFCTLCISMTFLLILQQKKSHANIIMIPNISLLNLNCLNTKKIRQYFDVSNFLICEINDYIYMQHHSNYMRYTSTLIIIIYQKYIVNEKNKNVKM